MKEQNTGKNYPPAQGDPEPKPNKTERGWIAAFKFVPLLVFATLVIVGGKLLEMELVICAPIATFVAILVYMLIYRERSFEKVFEIGLDATRKIALILFILMFAYGVAECFTATGVGASLILLALKLGISARTVAIVSLLVTCVLSIATGSSWGTFAACAPIFLWLNYLVQGDTMLTLCAIAGGSCFGDNIGLISDVTVLSCGMQDVKIVDRVKHQMVWCFGCLAVSLALFYVAGMHMSNESGDVQQALNRISPEAIEALEKDKPSALLLLDQVKNGVPYYMMIPMIVVIAMSFMGIHTLLCLGAGMISSLLLGVLAGTVHLQSWLNDVVQVGFSHAGENVIIMMMWVSAFGGIMNAMNTFEPLSRLVVKISRNVQQLMGWCGVLCLLGNAALADEAAQVTTMSPIVRDIVEKNVETESEEDAYKLRLRLATFTSSMGIYGSQLIPWHCFPIFFAGIASKVYPQAFNAGDILRKNYLGWLIVGTALLLTFTGWDRFVPGFGLPKNARLKKQEAHAAAE